MHSVEQSRPADAIANTASRRRYRCAIYTRKSSEEGLEQSFNSLDAQWEACTILAELGALIAELTPSILKKKTDLIDVSLINQEDSGCKELMFTWFV